MLGLDVPLGGVIDLFRLPLIWLGLVVFLYLVGGIGLVSSLRVDWLQECGLLHLTALAGMVLSGDLVVLVDGWGLDCNPTFRMVRVACSVGVAGLHLSRMACFWKVRASLLKEYRQIYF